jgi:hypothetical protein
VVPNEIDGGQQLGETLQGVVLALERDEDRIGRGQGIDGESPSDGGQSMKMTS